MMMRGAAHHDARLFTKESAQRSAAVDA